ncbi:MAG: cysteine--tRNA ligase [Caulobacter sp.]
MTLKLHDTMSRQKRTFVPADPDRVTMYVCGPTVYGYAHIGNARPVVVFDVLYRLLRKAYGDDAVVYARNVTDVDDKINAKATEEGVDISVITERYLAAYLEDMDALGALRPNLQPKATEHIDAILAQIGKLVENGSAYAAEGHVLFDTQNFKDYGQLSGRPLDDMIAGARVEVAPYKRHPADFVLWKPSKPNEPVWESPWGAGRPGWHIECSAMIEAQLGLPIDIHGGGIDLQFPHHENEVAQGRCAHGLPTYSRYWMHNGFLDMAGEKMSKSLGNVILPHELLKTVPGEVIRWSLLSAHYRQPLDWSPDLLEQSREALDRCYQALLDAKRLGVDDPDDARESDVAAFYEALSDDLNTPAAYAALFALYRDLREQLTLVERKEASINQARRRLAALLEAAKFLGFLTVEPEAWFQGAAGDDLKEKVEGLIAARFEARKAKDWARADAIRDEIAALGVEVMDGPQGATWRLKE